MGPDDLAQVLRHLPEKQKDDRLLVGHETSDDGGVYKLTDEIALIQTVDYFTPIVDDPYMFGQIAAANALSDVYAMGGKPTTVLNIVGYPIKKLPYHMLADILKGAADKVEEAGAVTVGGHSIDDIEPKFGLSVTGTVHPERVMKNVGAKPGDVLVLTKPVGVGILTQAIKKQQATESEEAAVTQAMTELNRVACESLADLEVHAVTDVTGFGLLGHAYEMANGSNVSFEFQYNNIPVLEGAIQHAQGGIMPGGTKANHKWLAEEIEYDEDLSEAEQFLLCDTITSGGLLLSMPERDAKTYLDKVNELRETQSVIVGSVKEKSTKTIYVK
ncbi:selenide, water dikinase SelD [Bacillus shivajii]|nr:selenide, water dikinase SelD [Bacillus shivajii]